jgi:hypothetical protein
MIPTHPAGPLVCNDVRHSRFVFDIEHPHHFATVASGLLGWRPSWDSLDAPANVNRKIHFSKRTDASNIFIEFISFYPTLSPA